MKELTSNPGGIGWFRWSFFGRKLPMKTRRWSIGVLIAGIIGLAGVLLARYRVLPLPGLDVVEKTNYSRPPADDEEVLSDDKLEDKQPVFDPRLADRRPRHWHKMRPCAPNM